MLLIRDIMYCKPGKVRPLVKKFLALAALTERSGMGRMRVVTDVSAERFWTVVVEIEVESLESFLSMMQDSESMKEMDSIMEGSSASPSLGGHRLARRGAAPADLRAVLHRRSATTRRNASKSPRRPYRPAGAGRHPRA